MGKVDKATAGNVRIPCGNRFIFQLINFWSSSMLIYLGTVAEDNFNMFGHLEPM